jgi:hypothetical protein
MPKNRDRYIRLLVGFQHKTTRLLDFVDDALVDKQFDDFDLAEDIEERIDEAYEILEQIKDVEAEERDDE